MRCDDFFFFLGKFKLKNKKDKVLEVEIYWKEVGLVCTYQNVELKSIQ